MGTANKLLSKVAKINFLGFPIEGVNKSILSGNPIRDSFSVTKTDNSDNDCIKIYITGGSQGAQYINKELPQIFKDLPYKIKIKHQCGQNNIETVKKIYLSNGIDAQVSEFYDNPVDQILWSDFVISRGGALTLSEITSVNRGVLVIPLPNSIDNHQVANAKIIENMNMGQIHEQNKSIESLKKKILQLHWIIILFQKMEFHFFFFLFIHYSLFLMNPIKCGVSTAELKRLKAATYMKRAGIFSFLRSAKAAEWVKMVTVGYRNTTSKEKSSKTNGQLD